MPSPNLEKMIQKLSESAPLLDKILNAIDGDAKLHRLDDFEVCKFVPHCYSKTLFAGPGCGANTLSLLIGKNPHRFKKPEDEDWKPALMASILEKHGFSVLHFNMHEIVPSGLATYPINERHVVILRVRFTIEEASWVVVHGKILYHNFEMAPVRVFEFICHPIMEMMVVCHPKWSPINLITERAKKRKAAMQAKRKQKQGSLPAQLLALPAPPLEASTEATEPVASPQASPQEETPSEVV